MTSGAAAGNLDRIGVAACGHTELTLDCECGQRAAAWWAETKRRLAEASPSRWAAAFGDQASDTAGLIPAPQDHDRVSAQAPAELRQLALFG